MTRTHKGIIYYDLIMCKFFQRRCHTRYPGYYLVSKLCGTIEEALTTKEITVASQRHIDRCQLIDKENIRDTVRKLNTTRKKYGKIQKVDKKHQKTTETQ